MGVFLIYSFLIIVSYIEKIIITVVSPDFSQFSLKTTINTSWTISEVFLIKKYCFNFFFKGYGTYKKKISW